MKRFIIIGAVLLLVMLAVMPASAEGIWHNGKFFGNEEDYNAYIDGATVIHNSKTGNDNKYRDTNPALSPEVWAGANTCTLEGNIRAGYNTLTKEVELKNVLQGNESGIIIPILPDGTFRYEGLAQGEYTLHIKAPFGVGADQYSRVTCNHGVVRPESELLGYAVSTDAPAVCQREIVSATYGEHVCYDEVSHMEYRSCKDVDKYFDWIEWKWVYYCDKWNSWQNSEPSNCKYSLPVSVCQKYCQSKKVTDKEAYCVGDYVTVTQNVRDVLAQGYTTFLFNNAKNPGGIFDITSTTRLSEIDDPAHGIVKSVSITYKDCSGIEQHINTMEYCAIDLMSGTSSCPTA